MTDWRVIVTDGLEESGIARLRESCAVEVKTGISAEDLLAIIGNFDAIIVRSRTKVTETLLAAGKNLKVVGRSGVGVDNIDLAAAKRLKISVVNSPIGPTIAVAELTFGLLISLLRQIPRADSAMKTGSWLKKDLMGAELFGKTLGIIGMGRIGLAVAERAKAFGMKIIAYDQNIDYEVIQKLGYQPVCPDEIYIHSDIISLHIPKTDQTAGMINERTFNLMKDGVMIVCTARGGLIDETALLAALNNGKVAGAALDVFGTEPPGATDLVLHPKVICTPHIGAQTEEAQSRTGLDVANEVIMALNDQPLRWKIV